MFSLLQQGFFFLKSAFLASIQIASRYIYSEFAKHFIFLNIKMHENLVIINLLFELNEFRCMDLLFAQVHCGHSNWTYKVRWNDSWKFLDTVTESLALGMIQFHAECHIKQWKYVLVNRKLAKQTILSDPSYTSKTVCGLWFKSLWSLFCQIIMSEFIKHLCNLSEKYPTN